MHVATLVLLILGTIGLAAAALGAAGRRLHPGWAGATLIAATLLIQAL